MGCRAPFVAVELLAMLPSFASARLLVFGPRQIASFGGCFYGKLSPAIGLPYRKRLLKELLDYKRIVDRRTPATPVGNGPRHRTVGRHHNVDLMMDRLRYGGHELDVHTAMNCLASVRNAAEPRGLQYAMRGALARATQALMRQAGSAQYGHAFIELVLSQQLAAPLDASWAMQHVLLALQRQGDHRGVVAAALRFFPLSDPSGGPGPPPGATAMPPPALATLLASCGALSDSDLTLSVWKAAIRTGVVPHLGGSRASGGQKGEPQIGVGGSLRGARRERGEPRTSSGLAQGAVGVQKGEPEMVPPIVVHAACWAAVRCDLGPGPGAGAGSRLGSQQMPGLGAGAGTEIGAGAGDGSSAGLGAGSRAGLADLVLDRDGVLAEVVLDLESVMGRELEGPLLTPEAALELVGLCDSVVDLSRIAITPLLCAGTGAWPWGAKGDPPGGRQRLQRRAAGGKLQQEGPGHVAEWAPALTPAVARAAVRRLVELGDVAAAVALTHASSPIRRGRQVDPQAWWQLVSSCSRRGALPAALNAADAARRATWLTLPPHPAAALLRALAIQEARHLRRQPGAGGGAAADGTAAAERLLAAFRQHCAPSTAAWAELVRGLGTLDAEGCVLFPVLKEALRSPTGPPLPSKNALHSPAATATTTSATSDSEAYPLRQWPPPPPPTDADAEPPLSLGPEGMGNNVPIPQGVEAGEDGDFFPHRAEGGIVVGSIGDAEARSRIVAAAVRGVLSHPAHVGSHVGRQRRQSLVERCFAAAAATNAGAIRDGVDAAAANGGAIATAAGGSSSATASGAVDQYAAGRRGGNGGASSSTALRGDHALSAALRLLLDYGSAQEAWRSGILQRVLSWGVAAGEWPGERACVRLVMLTRQLEQAGGVAPLSSCVELYPGLPALRAHHTTLHQVLHSRGTSPLAPASPPSLPPILAPTLIPPVASPAALATAADTTRWIAITHALGRLKALAGGPTWPTWGTTQS